MSERSGPGLRTLGEVITGASVVVGLVFVGVEISQNTATAEAQSRQELAAQNIDFLMRIAENEGLAAIWAPEWTSEIMDQLTPTERSRVLQVTIALMIRLENVYLQEQRGLVDEESLDNYGMDQTRFSQPGFWRFWDLVRDTFNPGFVEYFEALNPRVD